MPTPASHDKDVGLNWRQLSLRTLLVLMVFVAAYSAGRSSGDRKARLLEHELTKTELQLEKTALALAKEQAVNGAWTKQLQKMNRVLQLRFSEEQRSADAHQEMAEQLEERAQLAEERLAQLQLKVQKANLDSDR